MRNQVCVIAGRIAGHPSMSISQKTGRPYTNFVLEALPTTLPDDPPRMLPMVCFKLTAEYVGGLIDGDPVYIEYNVGSNTYVNQFGEERTNLSIFADEVHRIGYEHMPEAAIAVGVTTADPDAHFTAAGAMQTFIRLKVENEWLDRDGKMGGNDTTLNIMFTNEMAEQVAQHVEANMIMTVGFHLESRGFDRQDGTRGYNAFLAGDWYEADDAPAQSQEFGATAPAAATAAPPPQQPPAQAPPPQQPPAQAPPRQSRRAAQPAAAPVAAAAPAPSTPNQAFDPFADEEDLPFE